MYGFVLMYDFPFYKNLLDFHNPRIVSAMVSKMASTLDEALIWWGKIPLFPFGNTVNESHADMFSW